MEFGLFVDPVNLTQRHTLYDSDEEDENDKDTADITISDSGAVLVKEGGTLLVAVGTTASIFAQSHVSLVDSIVCSLVANSQTVFKGKFFPSPKSSHTTKNDDMVRVSEVYAVNSNSEREGDSCYVCVHEKPLKPEYCNAWASKVKNEIYVNSQYIQLLNSVFGNHMQVFECVRPSTVVLFTSCNAQDHFSPNTVKPDPCCMLRSLQTSNWSQPSLVSTFLEPPNTIAGEAAAGKC